MSVIVELTLPSRAFELGEILEMGGGTRVVLESVVPVGTRSVPFFRVYGASDTFEREVADRGGVQDITELSRHDDEVLYALDWDVSGDDFFAGVEAYDATVLEGKGSRTTWAFELRFDSHEALSSFRGYCEDEGIPLSVNKLFNPTKPDAGPWYGLTDAQRSALARAVEGGYYAIPRRISTKDLSEEFDISDQAMTERLRRAIANLAANTILVEETAARE